MLGSLPGPLEESLSVLVLNAEPQPLAVRQLAGRTSQSRKSGVIWGHWSVIPSVEVPGSPKELMVTPVLIVASELGTPAVEEEILCILKSEGERSY